MYFYWIHLFFNSLYRRKLEVILSCDQSATTPILHVKGELVEPKVSQFPFIQAVSQGEVRGTTPLLPSLQKSPSPEKNLSKDIDLSVLILLTWNTT